MKILEKMLKKHNLTSLTEEKGYSKFKVRQWETIEDKLKALNLYDEMSNKDLGIKKDYVA